MLRHSLALVVIWSLMMCSVPLRAASTVKRISLVGLSDPIPQPGNPLFKASTPASVYRISTYLEITTPASSGAIAPAVYCTTAAGLATTNGLVQVVASGNNTGQNTWVVRPTAGSTCYYYVDFESLTGAVQYNLYFTAEKI